ncbi:MAG: methyltransferase domain-containing protein [Halobacteriota archaeon]
MDQSLDVEKLEREVKAVYQDVAETPDGEFHFEMGRPLAERLGYPPNVLDRVPPAAIESFAGVGYHFDLAAIEPGDDVLDLGCGSGTDAFVAALHAGETGSVTGVDMTDEQLRKARQLRDRAGMDTVSFRAGYIEELPLPDRSVDVVVSNGVINLSAKKDRVFSEIERVLQPNGRVALSDIVSERQMPDSIKSNADLWAACIGGAMLIDDYTATIERAGLAVTDVRDNDAYEFISDRAQGACQKYGVKSIALAATKR